MAKKWLIIGLTGLALGGWFASAAAAQVQGARVRHARQFVRALELTRAQKLQALEIAQSARGARHARIASILPEVRALIATLTPEQRARIEALARRHGRTLDETRLERGLAFLLSRPGAAARIQRHLER